MDTEKSQQKCPPPPLPHSQFPTDLQNGALGDVVELAQLGNGGVVFLGDFAEIIALADGVIHFG